MKKIIITHKTGDLRGTALLPASKSISNRLLVLNRLPGVQIDISNLSGSGDTELLSGILKEIDQKDTFQHIINARNAGTVLRFLMALLSNTKGDFILDGNERMRHRPVGPLVNALRQLGAEISFLEQDGFPPVRIIGKRLHGGMLTVEAGISSQFITALMLIAPSLPGGLEITLTGQQVSVSYVDMTAAMMLLLGFDISRSTDKIRIEPSNIKKGTITVENDWSSAAFWYGMAMMAGTVDLELMGLSKPSVQGDAVISDWQGITGIKSQLTETGVRIIRPGNKRNSEELNIDLLDFPDLALPLIVSLAGQGRPALVRGIGHLKYKESDRIRALQVELARIGITLKENNEGWALNPKGINLKGKVHFSHHGDHRLAMALAGLALKGLEVVMEEPDVVGKSYPMFWDQMKDLDFNIDELS